MRLIEYFIATVMLLGPILLLIAHPLALIIVIGICCILVMIADSENKCRIALIKFFKFIGKAIYWVIGGITLIMMVAVVLPNPILLGVIVFMIWLLFLINELKK